MAKRKLMNQMNVVPYIDVMLVLLVIFMVTAPMIQLGNVELPSVGNLPAPPSQAAIVIVRAARQLMLVKPNPAAPEKNVDGPTLLRELQALKAKDPNLAIIVAGDRRATYEKIMDTFRPAAQRRLHPHQLADEQFPAITDRRRHRALSPSWQSLFPLLRPRPVAAGKADWLP